MKINQKRTIKKKTSNKKNEEGTKFITVGRLTFLKNYDSLIKGFAKIVKENPKCTLTIVGEGPERKKLDTLIKFLSLESNIFLVGAKENTKELLEEADYFVLSSISEGFPNVAIEATSAGLPLILSDFKTGARELVYPGLKFDKKLTYPFFGPNGVLLSIDNFENELIKIWHDKQKLTQKKEGFEKFNKMTIVSKWEKVLLKY